MIIVTGAAGFIGSNLVAALNARGERNIVAVDNLTHADKFKNLVDCEIVDFIDKSELLTMLPKLGDLKAVFHLGACSDTMETDGRYMMQNNYRYSVALLDHVEKVGVPLIYASSAAVYGGGEVFVEKREHESPLNVYGYSKFLFDQVVRRRMMDGFKSQVVGLRYFNVYGPRENHKGRMASVAFHHFHQFQKDNCVNLFGSWDGYKGGEQSRDFVYVDDVVAINLFFLDNPSVNGVFNCGSGRAQPFNDVAQTMVNTIRAEQKLSPLTREQMVENGLLRYIDFPDALKGKYQSYTRADLSHLRAVGCDHEFLSVQQGVERYAKWLSTYKA